MRASAWPAMAWIGAHRGAARTGRRRSLADVTLPIGKREALRVAVIGVLAYQKGALAVMDVA